MDFYNSTMPIRADLESSHRELVDHWSRPGTWWSAAERLAIIDQVRRARDINNPPPAWVPASDVEGLVGDSGGLPAKAIDTIWRLTNHPGTITVEWYKTIVDDEDPSSISPAHYTELVGVVAQANSLDRFTDALSMPRVDLPVPLDGDPTCETPDGTMMRDHWVPTCDTERAQVIRALSAVPAEKAMMLRLCETQYMDIDAMAELTADHNSLTRMQVELVAARTSKLNECFY